MNDPAYKISKRLVNEQNEYLNLHHQITTKNSINLEEVLTKLKLNSNFRMLIYDIKDLCVNIPTKENLRFTKSLLLKQNDAQTTKQIITLLDVILQQNYFSFKNLIYQTETGIWMVSPISSTITEVFFQNMESILMKQLFDKKNIAFYTRYVDDILLTYHSHHVTPEKIHSYINRIHSNFQFNPTYDSNNGINFLELLTIRNQSNLPIDIYRKPAPTDTTINFLSNHTTEHKTAAYRYHTNRRLTEEGRQREWETIQTRAQNYNLPNTHIARLKTQTQQKAHIRTSKDKKIQHLHTSAQKSESLPIYLNIQT